MTDPIAHLRKLTEAVVAHKEPSLRAGDDWRAFSRAASPQTVLLLLDLVEEADNLANMTDAHTRRHYDATRAALERANEPTEPFTQPNYDTPNPEPGTAAYVAQHGPPERWVAKGEPEIERDGGERKA